MTDKQIAAKCKRKAKTRAELGITRTHVLKLVADGLVAPAGFEQTGKQGRPAVKYLAA